MNRFGFNWTLEPTPPIPDEFRLIYFIAFDMTENVCVCLPLPSPQEGERESEKRDIWPLILDILSVFFFYVHIVCMHAYAWAHVFCLVEI